MRTLLSLSNWLLIPLLLFANFSYGQSVTLEQGQNGGVDKTPLSPIVWATGNSNSGNSHFIEGQSIPYRMTISRLRPGANTVVIEWDTRTGSKSAIDYVTSFDRICETVIPNPGTPSFFQIPAPSGLPQPAGSFSKLKDSEKRMAIYGGTISSIQYLLQGSTVSASAITRVSISFNVVGANGPNNTVVIAWGGHIASAQDWGEGNSASSISGSPYHTRVVSINGTSVGNQNRSVQAASGIIDPNPECTIIGASELCSDTSTSYSVPAGAFSYAWSVTEGGGILSGQGTNSIQVKWTTSGTVSVYVDNVGACLPTQCSLNVNVNPLPTITVTDPVLCSIENGGNTAMANLNDYASVVGGELIFKIGGVQIETPASVLVTNGDVIEVTAVGNCGTTQTLNVTVNDRQIFGICSQGKMYEPIGSELKALYEIFRRGQTVGSNEIFYISGNEVLIEVIYFKDKFEAVKSLLLSMGFVTPTEEELKQDPNSLIVAGFIPIGNLLELNNSAHQEIINYVRPAIPGIPNKGATTSQGDRVMRSNLVRAGYIHTEGDQAIDGTGIKIGVLSDSYATRSDAGVNPISTDISNGDLPTEPLYFRRDLPSRFGIGTDEGRAMLQIVHDIAPGAQLGFRTGVITAGDFAQGIRDLAAEGSDIIVDDITYITEPFFSDGKVAKAVNEVAANGVSYFTSAGNFGNKSFEGVFNPVQDPSISLPLKFGEWNDGGRVHQFSNGTTQTIKVFPGKDGPAVYMIVLQWDDPLYSIDQVGSEYDLDIYLKDFGVPLFGFNRNNSNGDPLEILSFTVTEETTIDLVIARECESCTDLDSNKGIKFKYVVFRGDLDPNDPNGINSSTVVGHANSEGAMTVGAVLYANTEVFGFDPALVPAGTEPFTVASFSSRGGTMTNGNTRAKPDFVGPNGVNTTVNLGAPNLEVDEDPMFPNFFGTSAAAPHVAAVAALIKQARLKYYPSTSPEGWQSEVGKSLPADIRRVLKTSAEDMHETGDDFKSGSGLVRADQALLQLAAPKPGNLELVYGEGITPGETGFTLVIKGTNLNEGSEVFLRDEPVTSTYNEDEEGVGYLEVTIPAFEGNPGVTVVNDPISETKEDGGTAGPVYFFDAVKKTIAIRAGDQTFKYGQVIDPFKASVYELVEGNWELSTLTLEDVGLTLNLVVENSDLVPLTLTSTIAGDFPEVGTYIIKASHPQTALTFSDFYNYVGEEVDGIILYEGNSVLGNYGLGIITVQPLPITIKPVNLALKYGESISEALEYEVSIPEEFVESDGKVKIADVQGLKNSILSKYLLDLELAKREGDDALPLGIFNGSIDLNRADFINKSFMVSAATVGSARSIINISGRTIINTSTTGRSIINTTTTTGRSIINSAFDVPAASFLDYLEDQDNQTLLNVAIGRTIINTGGRTIINAGRTMINAQSLASGRTIINTLSGNARTIINARPEINGSSGRTIINSVEGGQEEENNSLVIYGEADLNLAEEAVVNGEPVYDFGADIPADESDDSNQEFFPVTMVTGTDVGNHFIIPGTLASRNLKVSYEPADLTIDPAPLTATTAADPVEIMYGDTAPEYETVIEGFETSTKFLDSDEIEVTLDDFESEIDTLEYSLLKGGVTFASDGLIAAGVYEINPIITLTEPSNYIVGTINRGLFTVNKATPTVIVSVDFPVIEYPDPVTPSGFAYGIGGEADLLEQNMISFEYQGTGSTSYGPASTAPILPGTYQVIAKFAGNGNYSPASSAVPAAFTIIGCVNVAPVMSGTETARGSGNTNTSATIKKPAGTVVGDLLIVGLMLEKGASPDVTPPKDWIRINRVNQLNQVAMATFYKIVKSGNEPDTYTFRISQSPKWSMGIARVVGADIAHPDGPIVTRSGVSGTTAIEATAPSLTTVDCNTLVLAFFTNKKNATWTPPSGTIEAYDDPNNQQGLTSNMMSYFVQTDPGATGDLTAIASQAESWVAQAIAIRPKVNNTQTSRLLPPVVEPNVELPEGVSALSGEEVIGELKAYPNPVNDKLNLSLKGYFETAPDESSMILTDAMGRILPWQGTWNQKERMMEMDFSTMNTGLYIINIRTTQGIKSIRVIKKY